MTSDLPTLLPTCKSWEDHLWARCLSRIESRLESRWRELGGFWEEEARAASGDAGAGAADENMRTAGQGAGGMDGMFRDMGEIQDAKVQ